MFNSALQCKVKEMAASRGSMKKGILALWRFKRGDYFKDYKGQVLYMYMYIQHVLDRYCTVQVYTYM